MGCFIDCRGAATRIDLVTQGGREAEHALPAPEQDLALGGDGDRSGGDMWWWFLPDRASTT